MQIQYVYTLFGAVGLMLVVQFKHLSGFHSHVPAAAPNAIIPELKHCLVLTLNDSMKPVSFGSGLVCRPFLGQKFDEQQWALVSDAAKIKLIEPDRQTMASDLTNNQSVSIFANHAAVWRQVVALREKALILEDDAVLTYGNVDSLNEMLHLMRHEHNFVLKLWNSAQLTNPRILSVWVSNWLLQWWKQWYRVSGYTAMLCVCDNAIRTAGAAAYVLDWLAAESLLRHHLPLAQHVDAYMHMMGCAEKKLNFSVITPPMAALSGRATQHKVQATWNLWQRHVNEIRNNLRTMDCFG